MNNDTTMHANDLTQLSSREQLSALMDDALPADETRFLLRRLQHDAPLAHCWERWRLTGEVMRGLAPTQRLPSDFATRVSAALHGGSAPPVQVASARTPAWMRWGGGAAIAASLAVAALVVRQPSGDIAPAVAVAAVATPATQVPAPAPADAGTEAQALAAAGALAATARPDRDSRRSQQAAPIARPRATAAGSVQIASAPPAAIDASALPLMPQPDIVSRPWPRSVLPQYASDSLAVGFGQQGSAVYNPFPTQPVMPAPPEDAAGRSDTPVPADGDAGTPPQP